MKSNSIISNTPSPNDQRAMTKNPQTDEYAKDRENRVKLGHPNIPGGTHAIFADHWHAIHQGTLNVPPPKATYQLDELKSSG